MTSSSVYLLVAQDRGHCLKLIRSCIRFESNAGGNFFEILFLKEQAKFIDFRRVASKQYAAELRELYSTRTINDILFELSSRVLSVPVTFNTIFDISLTGLPLAFYPINSEISN